jgi:hypothetical protein
MLLQFLTLRVGRLSPPPTDAAGIEGEPCRREITRIFFVIHSSFLEYRRSIDMGERGRWEPELGSPENVRLLREQWSWQ